jgi:osomolarity two-component system response regulator SSK1
MDIQMPIMDGIEATREIRRMEILNATSEFSPLTPSQTLLDASTPSSTSTNDTRSTNASSPYRSSVIIVALTASSLQSDRVNALAAGCNDFLTKPVSLLWLNNKIIEWGSIKALQMWADIRPEAMRKLSRGQAAQARAIAARLHMPQNRNLPSKQPTISEAIATLSEPLTAATPVPTPSASTSASPDPAQAGDGTTPAINPLNPTTENSTPTLFTPPKRRRSQKRESAPESVKAKAVDASEGQCDFKSKPSSS